MKRIIGIVCLLLVMVTMLAACSKYTCASCKETRRGDPCVLEVAGEKFTLCNACYQEYQKKQAEMNAPVKDGVGDLTKI